VKIIKIKHEALLDMTSTSRGQNAFQVFGKCDFENVLWERFGPQDNQLVAPIPNG